MTMLRLEIASPPLIKHTVSGGKASILFIYLGRRGAMPVFMQNLVASVQHVAGLNAFFCVSSAIENLAKLQSLDPKLMTVETFQSNLGMITQAWRIRPLTQNIINYVKREQITAVVNLMPHVWSSVLAKALKKRGVSYTTIVHDAVPHPGDYRTRVVHPLLMRDVHHAQNIVVLSDAVEQVLKERYSFTQDKIIKLFHPVFRHELETFEAHETSQSWRVLFLGRIMPYKGLSLLLDAIDILKQQGVSIELGVFGQGDLKKETKRLRKLNAKVQNHWLTDLEVTAAVSSYDAVMLPYLEASQSGVVATAFGAGKPVVATPVGGLSSQVKDNYTGTVSTDVTAASFAKAISRLMSKRENYKKVCDNIALENKHYSPENFVRLLLRHIVKS